MAQPKDFWDWPFHWQLLLWPLALGAWIEEKLNGKDDR